MPKIVFGKINYKEIKQETPNGDNKPFKQMPANPYDKITKVEDTLK